MQSKRDGRKLQMFQLELSDSAEAEALISSNLTCPQTGIIFKVEEYRAPISVQQCYNCQHFGHSAKNCQAKTKCVICGEGHSHKGCPNREKKQPKCANCKGPHVANYKGCPAYKKQVFRQRVVDNQKKLRLYFKAKFGSVSTTPGWHILFYGRPARKICSHCGHTNRSATGVPQFSPKRCSW